MMRNMIRCTAGLALALTILSLIAPPAVAQTTFDRVVVTIDDRRSLWDVDESAKVSPSSVSASANLIDEAINRVVSGGTVVLDQGNWPSPTHVGKSVTIMGNPLSPPYAVVIQGNGAPVLDVNGNNIDVTVEGVTLRGGTRGVWLSGIGVSVAVNRCLLLSNSLTGLSVTATTGLNQALIVNSYLGGNGTGVRLSGPNSRAAIVFCTFRYNAAAGIAIEDRATARVFNTVLYENQGFTDEITLSGGGNIVGRNNYVPNKAAPNVSALSPVFDSSDFPPDFDDGGSAPWPGKILDTSALQSKGASTANLSLQLKDFPFSLGKYVSSDLELTPRPMPSSSAPDIGADEAPDSDAPLVQWYYCSVTQPDSPNEGVVGNKVRAELRFYGMDPPDEVYWIPQGGEPTLRDRQALRRTINVGGGVAVYESPAIFSTVLQDRDASGNPIVPSGDGNPTQGDLIADGHAYIHVLSIPDDSEKIVGQAKIGRHFLVDTIPPRLLIEQPITAQTPVLAADKPVIWAQGGPFGAWSGAIDPATHPFLASIPLVTQWRQVEPSALPYAPWDDGFISSTPGSSNGPQVFFNQNSRSNADTTVQPLLAHLAMTFVDPPVRDAGGNDISGVDYLLPGLTTRAPSGFNPAGGGVLTGEETGLANLATNTQAGLIRVAGQDIAAQVAYTHQTQMSGPYETFVPGLDGAADSKAPAPNRMLFAEWSFSGGIADAGQSVHLGVRFDAKDRAGNWLSASPSKGGSGELDPAHLWWMVGDTKPQARIVQNIEGQTLDPSKLTVSWTLDRSEDPQITGPQPTPLYAYRLWVYNDAWDTSDAPDGPYVPLPLTAGRWASWSAWDTTRGLLASDFQDLIAKTAIRGKWMLLTVVGMDEAGNVDPLTETQPGGAELQCPSADGPITVIRPGLGRNWRRFQLGDVVDTTVSYSFWNEDRSFGAATLLPHVIDRNLHGAFRVNGIFPDSSGIRVIDCALYQDGNLTWTGSATWTYEESSQTWTASVAGSGGVSPVAVSVGALSVEFSGLGNPNRVVTYVFQATARVGAGNPIDPTPARVQFTVTPAGPGGTVQDYVKPPHAPDDQPITVHENL